MFGLSSGLLILFALALHNWKRSRVRETSDLQPNRLLTRYPLVFLSGKRSLFYFMTYWNQIPSYLANHGYEVFLKPLPWSKDELRLEKIHQFLEYKSQQNKPLHLIIDSSSQSQVESLLNQHSYPCVRSLSLIQSPTPIPNPLFWKIHLLVTGQNPKQSIHSLGFQLSDSLKTQFLDRCQFLAERDLIQGDRSTSLNP